MIYTDLTRKAITVAYNAHQGQLDRAGLPYILHPLHVAEQMKDEDTCVVALLHDVIEDCGRKLEDLPVNDETKELVRLLTCQKTTDSDREQILTQYYEGILSNPKAALIKCMDRCNNLTTMSWGLSRDKIYRMINETEKYYPKLLETVKATPEYNSAAWLLKYQIESMLDIYKRLM